MPIYHWSREAVVRFLLEAVTLVGAAIAETATGDDPTEEVMQRLHYAVSEARLAYEFQPSSYTAGVLNACLAASEACAELRAARGADAFRGAL